MSPITGRNRDESSTKDQAEAASKAIDKVNEAEASKGQKSGGGVGRRIHEGRRENA